VNRGYVKVWRKIEDSGLIQLPNTLALFMHLLLNATHKDRKVGTTTGVVELKRGQYISGINKLSNTLEQTVRQIRTSIDRLINLGIITVQATNKYSIYTIENYNIYQDSDTQNDKQTANKRQSNDKETTTKQELNNLNIKELILSEVSEDVFDQWIALRKKKKAADLSSLVYQGIKRESIKAGLTIEEAIIFCVERSWTAFNADWYQQGKKQMKGHGVVTDAKFNEWLGNEKEAING
jgi:hypothetical protein